MNLRIVSRALLCGLLVLSSGAHAVSKKGDKSYETTVEKPVPSMLDTQLVRYPYDPNKHYNIITSANKMTHLEFGVDERVVGVYLLDSQTAWRTVTSGATHRDVFITPAANGLSNSGTIITTKRQYELTFITQDTNAYYQRVSWAYPDVDTVTTAGGIDMGTETLVGGASNLGAPDSTSQGRENVEVGDMKGIRHESGDVPPAASDVDQALRVDLNHANFDYEVDGEAPFKPTTVFDDGHATYIKLTAQSLPGAFELSKDGQGDVLPFVPRNGYFVIPRVPQYGILLLLGDQQVRIYNRKSKACGFFGCSHKPVTNIVGQGS